MLQRVNDPLLDAVWKLGKEVQVLSRECLGYTIWMSLTHTLYDLLAYSGRSVDQFPFLLWTVLKVICSSSPCAYYWQILCMNESSIYVRHMVGFSDDVPIAISSTYSVYVITGENGDYEFHFPGQCSIKKRSICCLKVFHLMKLPL